MMEPVEIKDGIVFYDIEEPVFSVHGVFRENGRYVRIPTEIAEKTSEAVKSLNIHTAGGRVRFRTNSVRIDIRMEQDFPANMPHFPSTGSNGLDLYVKYPNGFRFDGIYMPPVSYENGFAGSSWRKDSEMRECIIHLPQYSDLTRLLIGIEEGAAIEPASPYATQRPVAFYGSSITQGGCSTRPGTSYENMLSRELDFDYVNLGFSGSAKGEPVIMDYIAGLDMSAFVYDYDYNADSPEHLANTHEAGFRKIRATHPELPVLMLSRPIYTLSENAEACRRIILNTYENALRSGDRNVRFLDGPALMALAGDDGTVDGVHPNDLGFRSMAAAIGPVLREMLK